VSEGAIGLPKISFFDGSNVTADSESSEDNMAGSLMGQAKITENNMVKKTWE